MAVRDPLDWSLPLVWHSQCREGNTPMISRRLVDFGAPTIHPSASDLKSDTHIVTGTPTADRRRAFAGRNCARRRVHPPQRSALPRARLVGKPVYADDQTAGDRGARRLAEPPSATSSLSKIPLRPLADGRRSRARPGLSKTSRNVSWSKPTRRRPRISFWPTRSTRAGRPPSTAGRHRSGPPTSPSGPSIFRREAHGRFHLPSGGLRAGVRCSAAAECCSPYVFWFWPRSSTPLAPEHAVLDWPSALADMVVPGSGSDRADLGRRRQPERTLLDFITAGTTASTATPGERGSRR